MAIKEEIAISIVRGLKKFLNCEDFQDFTVAVETVQFRCHRLLLAACSDFFSGLFRSGMQETEMKCVTIKDISSKTFELILESMYTSCDVLTKDNVIDIWRAAHQLQIHYLVLECENFVIKYVSLENYVEYLQTCKALNSTLVLGKVWDFILKNGNSFFDTSYFLEISLSEVEYLIKSQSLVVKSEDDVICALVKWAEFSSLAECQCNPQYVSIKEVAKEIFNEKNGNEENEIDNGDESCRRKSKTCHENDKSSINTVSYIFDKGVQTDLIDKRPNEENIIIKKSRCKNLAILLSHARTCLVSKRCLEMLINHDLVNDNEEARDIVIEALLYQVRNRNGHWPPRAVHRNNSNFKHCMVSIHKSGEKELHVYDLAEKKWFELPGVVMILSVNLAVVNKKLFALCVKLKTNNRLGPYMVTLSQLLPRKNSWSEVEISLTLSSYHILVAVIESLVYIFSANENKMWKLDTDSLIVTEITELPGFGPIHHVMPYEQCLLVFHASTIVRCYDTSLNIWTRINSTEGPANGMTSFVDAHFTYILQSNGNLCKVVKTQSNIIDFEFLVKLWSGDWPLHGAVAFMDELYIHGASMKDVKKEDLLFGRPFRDIFKQIRYMPTFSESTMSLPFLLEQTTEEQE